MPIPENPTRTGYVALAGRPNVGKSTLLNKLVGEKVSITSDKPQTTRQRLIGIKSVSGGHQVLYVDTPGLHPPTKNALNRYMNRAASSSLTEVDVVVLVVEALQWRDEDEYVLKLLRALRVPVVLAVNKVDKLAQRGDLLPYIEQVSTKFEFAQIFPLSALSGVNVPELETCLVGMLPEGVPLFPEDQLTDRSERFLAAELVREKLMRRLGQELPYRLSVEIELFKEEPPQREGQSSMLHIGAVIWVERPGQKAIVIGKNGAMLKNIGSQARLDMERLFGCKVFLQLWVKVKSGWSDDERLLKQLGYND